MHKLLLSGVAIALTLSVFAEAAVAGRGVGSKRSQTGDDETFINFQFVLFDTGEDGRLIPDRENRNRQVGLFEGAIVDFTKGQGRACINNNSPGDYVFDGEGNLEVCSPFEPTSDFTPFTGSLRAELFRAGSDPLFSDRNPFNSGLSSPIDLIAYTLLTPAGETALSYRLRLGAFNRNQAINNLSYILNNNLLDRSRLVGNSGLYAVGGCNPADPSSSCSPFLSIGALLPQGEVIDDTPAEPVPEPGTIAASMLASIAVSTGLMIKRRRSKQL